ncbi:MAG: lysine--tRNA ligase [Bacilli bacterium]|nr:lysine--tRNA ligase [Bacilli bacterium]MBR3162020.1 lysine--tRNA ligase [Bacilli bacterium]
MNWAKEVAMRIIEERPDEEVYTVASGVSPSGFVHIGNFREIATPYLVAKELKKLGKKVRYILSFDEFDRFRKVPGNIDSSYEKYVGMPYTDIPSPFTKNESYASYMENRFLNELKSMDVEVECIYQTKEYQSGRYNEYIKIAMDNRDKIFSIIDDFRTQDSTDEERKNYYPISIYCSKCKKDLTTISNYDSGTGDVTYSCECGHTETINISSATNIKLQWKVDWPMRWMVEKVTFETGGVDHSAANGSKAVSERVAKEIYNYEPPVYIPYNFIGIKGGGAKMSSSAGNVLTITDLLKVYDKNIIWWFYARFDNMHAFDIALDNDVIRYYSEFDRWVKLYFSGNIDDKNKSILELTEVKENYLKYPNFSYLATFLPIVNFDIDLLKKLLVKASIDVDTKEFEERLELAKNWVKEYGSDYQVNLLEERNNTYYESLNDLEKEWLKKTILLLDEEYETTDDLQTALYGVVKDGILVDKELKQTQKRYFQILYNMLLGKDKGPKLGLFLSAVDKEKIKNLL